MNIHNMLCILAIFLHSPQAILFAKEGQQLFWCNEEEKQRYQTEKVTQIINYAVRNTLYYAKAFEGKSLEIDNAPVLTKDILRKSYLEICSIPKRRGLYKNTSGGSTGEPVTFIQDKEFYDKNFGNKILFGLLNEKLPGDTEIKLWGSERDILSGSIGIKEKIVNSVYNRTLLNSFVMSESNIQLYIEQINKKRPMCLWTYADSVYELAKYAIEKQLKVFNPQIIISTAGVLYDEMRKTIQKCFPQSYICNQYGSREVGAIGVEVKGERGIRVFDHSVYIEILNEKTGQISREGTGRILVTSLINKAMPLIRYDIGDIGTFKQGAGGRMGSFSILDDLKGRVNCHIKRKNGEIIHGEYFTHLFYGKDWVKTFQIVQHSDYNLEFLIVLANPNTNWQKDIDEMIKNTKVVMPEADISINFVDSVPRLKSGKYQFILSEIL